MSGSVQSVRLPILKSPKNKEAPMWHKDFNNKLLRKMKQIQREVRQHEESKAVVQGKIWKRGEPLSNVDKELEEFITEKDVTANIYR